MSLVRQIAPSCAWVAAQAENVVLHRDKIPDYARFIAGRYNVTTVMSDDHLVTGPAETKAAYILALDSVNFGSGYFRLAQEYGLALEYTHIAGGLKRWFEAGRFTQAEDWATVTAEDFSQMLSIPVGLHPDLDRLLLSFAMHLRETGEKLLGSYQGSVLNLLEACDRSAVTLADTVALWRGFHDVQAYKGRQIPLLKRAQILAADLNLALGGICDIDKLTIFADNMVPHVLRCDGILDYSSDGIIPAGSAKEVEIRAVAIHAVEEMKKHVAGLTAVNLDHMLWHRGYEPALYAQKPHRTLTTWY